VSYIVTAHIRSRVVGHAVKKAILLVMADAANHDGSDIWLSKPTISAETEYGISTIKKHMRELVAVGEKYEDFTPLIIETGKRRVTNGFVKIYKIDLEAISALPLSKVIDQTGGLSLAPVNNGENSDVTPTGAGDAPDTGQDMPPNNPEQSDNSPSTGDIFEKLWKKIIEITPVDIRTRHKKKPALAKFTKIVTRKENSISASRVANAVLWFYASPEQTRDGGRYMPGLVPLLNSENFTHFLDKGVYDRAESKEAKSLEAWQIRADYVNQNAGEWPPSAPSPRTCPKDVRKLFDKQHWEALGWTE